MAYEMTQGMAYKMTRCAISHVIAMLMINSVTICLPWQRILFMPFTILVPMRDSKTYSRRTRASK